MFAVSLPQADRVKSVINAAEAARILRMVPHFHVRRAKIAQLDLIDWLENFQLKARG